MSLHAKIMALKPPAYYEEHEQLRRIGFFDGAEKAAELAAQHDAVMEQMAKALEWTWRVIDAAGLYNLANGVQLGSTVWYVKATEAESASREALAAHAEVTNERP